MKFLKKWRRMLGKFRLRLCARCVIYFNDLLQRIFSMRHGVGKNEDIAVSSDFSVFFAFNEKICKWLHERKWTFNFSENFAVARQYFDEIGVKEFFSGYVRRYLPDVNFDNLCLRHFSIDPVSKYGYSFDFWGPDGTLLTINVSFFYFSLDRKDAVRDRVRNLYLEMLSYIQLNLPFPINVIKRYMNRVYFSVNCSFSTPYYDYEFNLVIGNVNTYSTVYNRKIRFFNEKDREVREEAGHAVFSVEV